MHHIKTKNFTFEFLKLAGGYPMKKSICSIAAAALCFSIAAGTARATCNSIPTRMIQGTWGFMANGHEIMPGNTSGAAPTPPPVLAVGAITFDGRCGVTGEEILNDKGTITAPTTCGSPTVPCFDPTKNNLTGTYTLNGPGYDGVMALTDSVAGKTFNFAIQFDNSTHELRGSTDAASSPVLTLNGYSDRQFAPSFTNLLGTFGFSSSGFELGTSAGAFSAVGAVTNDSDPNTNPPTPHSGGYVNVNSNGNFFNCRFTRTLAVNSDGTFNAVDTYLSSATCPSPFGSGSDAMSGVAELDTRVTVGSMTFWLLQSFQAMNTSPATRVVSSTGFLEDPRPVLYGPTSIDFGTVTTGTNSAPMTVGIRNNQQISLNIRNVSTTSGQNFPLDTFSGPCAASGGTLAPNTTCSTKVICHPGSQGTFTGSLKIVDDANTSPQLVSLKCTGN